MGDLTKNFSYKEFKPNGENDTWKPAFYLQDLMLQELAKNLQIIRDIYNKSLSINSGIRLASDFLRLLNDGYHPSPVSDHFCGNIVPIEKTDKRCSKFGQYYAFSVGAADIASDNSESLFKLSIKLNIDKKTNFGQIIWEKDPVKKTEWIHFSNNRETFYSKLICDLISKEKYLYTVNGGQTYNIFTV